MISHHESVSLKNLTKEQLAHLVHMAYELAYSIIKNPYKPQNWKDPYKICYRALKVILCLYGLCEVILRLPGMEKLRAKAVFPYWKTPEGTVYLSNQDALRAILEYMREFLTQVSRFATQDNIDSPPDIPYLNDFFSAIETGKPYFEGSSFFDVMKLRDRLRNTIVELHKKRHPKRTASTERKVASQKQRTIEHFPTPEGTKWHEVTMTFVSEEKLKITAREISETYRFEEIGFKNMRKTSGVFPNKQWEFLKLLAVNNGRYEWGPRMGTIEDEKSRDIAKSHASKLRKFLKEIMRIDDDPFKDYRMVGAYETKFTLINRSDM